jgi:hypothetical protein
MSLSYLVSEQSNTVYGALDVSLSISVFVPTRITFDGKVAKEGGQSEFEMKGRTHEVMWRG